METDSVLTKKGKKRYREVWGGAGFLIAYIVDGDPDLSSAIHPALQDRLADLKACWRKALFGRLV